MSILKKGMAEILSRTWWTLLLRGLLAIAFAILAWTQPRISIAALVLLFGGYILIDGFVGVIGAITARKERENWFVLLLWGMVGIAVGLMTLANPRITAFALLFYIAIWSIGTGLLEIVTAIRLREEIENEWWLVLSGLASVVLGIVLMARPYAGALALLWLIAAYALVFGLLLVIVAFKVRTFGKDLAAA